MAMYGTKALELVKELKRCDVQDNGFLPPYNDKLLKEVFVEMKDLYEQNKQDVSDLQEAGSDTRQPILSAVKIRHHALIRNHRCVMAYLQGRHDYIRKLRWGFGSQLPDDIQHNMSESESKYFEEYNRLLFGYMRKQEYDLTSSMEPPRNTFVSVRCLTDFGDLILSDGNKVVLKRGSMHMLARNDCEQLIKQGVLEHVLQSGLY